MSASSHTRNNKENSHETHGLMEQLVSRKNMAKAYRQVVSNRGSAGVDGMQTSELKDHLKGTWPETKEALLSGKYYPQVVLQVEISKPTGGKRKLGIPTVMDRMIQQAIHQVLSPLYEPEFSEWSYGFRPGRNAQQAVERSRTYIQKGKRWVIDMDLSNFFDEVHHDRLLSKLRKKITDRRVIHLIDRYLRAGIMKGGVEEHRRKGTPQGSPLSPLLSNIVLDELDKELESRGHCFVRYADDFQIYVGSRRTAERVMESLIGFIEGKLRLKVNRSKSAIDRPWRRSFLGYSFTLDEETKLKVSPESVQRLKGKLKEKFRKGRGRNLSKFISEDLNPLLRGWISYFSKSDVKGLFELLDGWIRRHLRKIIWRQMKRSWTRMKTLITCGLSEEQAVRSSFNQRGAWWNSGASHMNRAYPKRFFDRRGLVSLQNEYMRYHLMFNAKNRRDT